MRMLRERLIGRLESGNYVFVAIDLGEPEIHLHR
jgi:hypothetical protein